MSRSNYSGQSLDFERNCKNRSDRNGERAVTGAERKKIGFRSACRMRKDREYVRSPAGKRAVADEHSKDERGGAGIGIFLHPGNRRKTETGERPAGRQIRRTISSEIGSHISFGTNVEKISKVPNIIFTMITTVYGVAEKRRFCDKKKYRNLRFEQVIPN